MNIQLAKMRDVLKMDLSTIVQKVSLGHATTVNFFGFEFILGKVNLSSSLQGFSSLNDTPHMVTEQTRSVVESEFENASFFSLFSHLFSRSVLRPFVALAAWLNHLSLRCAESDGRHRQKHQQLFQNIPRAELPVKLYNLYQPCSRQDWGLLPWNWQNGLLQVKQHPKSWQKRKRGMCCDVFSFTYSDLAARLLAFLLSFWVQLSHVFTHRWIGCITLCCMLVLVLAFNYLGLLCGTLGYDKHASPTTRGCISNTGGTMLIAWVFCLDWNETDSPRLLLIS